MAAVAVLTVETGFMASRRVSMHLAAGGLSVVEGERCLSCVKGQLCWLLHHTRLLFIGLSEVVLVDRSLSAFVKPPQFPLAVQPLL
jgi:hypothetical protein